MSASDFKRLVVDPILWEAEADPLVYHRVFSLVLALDAWSAHIFAEKNSVQGAISWPSDIPNRDDTGFRELLARQSANFELLRDIAKALKHCELVRGSPVVSGSRQVNQQSLGFGQGGYGEGPFGGGPQIVVNTNAGQTRNVISICRHAIKFLEGQ